MSATESMDREPTPAGAMTYEEFLDWADEDMLAEWVDGQVIMTSPASARHQLVAFFVGRILARYVELHHLGIVLLGHFQQHLPSVRSGREPDVLFLACEHPGRLQPATNPTHVEGPGDLVVEAVSPESVERDYDDKRHEYEQGGVPEYWILNPATQRADFYHLDAQGRYQRAAPDAQGIYHGGSAPGFWLRVDWLWQDPLPDVDEAVRQIATPEYLDDLAAGLDDAAARALLDRLRRLGKLPEQDG